MVLLVQFLAILKIVHCLAEGIKDCVQCSNVVMNRIAGLGLLSIVDLIFTKY